ncbi:MAG: lipopolysaccharide kinase InaA family protein [Microbacter sp.]
MTTKIIVSPTHQSLHAFLTNIPNTFPVQGKTIYKARNEIKLMKINGELLVVKSYKQPHFINRIAYGLLRKSKAHRAFEYAQRLIDKQINTPFPIAYIEQRTMGLLTNSYFISAFCPYTHLLRELWDYASPDKHELIQSFAIFTTYLHSRNIYPVDYSPGNILFEKGVDGFQFSLIDINRMRFTEVSPRMAAFGFRRLRVDESTLTEIAETYANLRSIEKEKFIQKTLRFHRQFWKKPH